MFSEFVWESDVKAVASQGDRAVMAYGVALHIEETQIYSKPHPPHGFEELFAE